MSSARLLAPKATSMLGSTSVRAAARPALRSNMQLQMTYAQRGISGEIRQSTLSLLYSPSERRMLIRHCHSRRRTSSPKQQRRQVTLPSRQAPTNPQVRRRWSSIPSSIPPILLRARQRSRRSRSTSRYRSRYHWSCWCRCRYRYCVRVFDHRCCPQPKLARTAVLVCHSGFRLRGSYRIIRAHGCLHDSLHLNGFRVIASDMVGEC